MTVLGIITIPDPHRYRSFKTWKSWAIAALKPIEVGMSAQVLFEGCRNDLDRMPKVKRLSEFDYEVGERTSLGPEAAVAFLSASAPIDFMDEIMVLMDADALMGISQ